MCHTPDYMQSACAKIDSARHHLELLLCMFRSDSSETREEEECCLSPEHRPPEDHTH